MIETYMLAAMQLSIAFCLTVVVASYILIGFTTLLSYALQLGNKVVKNVRTAIGRNMKRPVVPETVFTNEIGVPYGRIAYK
jgi:hypothetical protein